MKNLRPILGLAGWLALSFGAARFGAQYEPGGWYQALDKPPWTPPGWVFAVVWTLLYILMGVAAWLVWLSGRMPGIVAAIAVFVVQLFLNAFWPWIFFGHQLIGLAFVEIVVLDLAVLLTLVLFWRQRPVAGALLIPYLLWLCFATTLNLAFWLMNS